MTRFTQALLPGTLERRYQRFLADVTLVGNRRITAHCPNTGAMTGCAAPGSRVWLSVAANQRRKYPHTWELVQAAGGTMVGIHTGRTNTLAEDALTAGLLPELAGYERLRREVRVPGERMRADFLLSEAGKPDCFVEVKNVTAAVAGGVALFPDTVSERASRHVEALTAWVRSGYRAALVFVAQRDDVREVRPADTIDPRYGRVLREALTAGVEAFAIRAQVTPQGIFPHAPIPVACPAMPSSGSAGARGVARD